MIVEANNLLDKLMDIRKTASVRKGVTTGFSSLDEFIYLSKQYLMVLTGMPSCGKSEVLDAMAVNTAVLHDWKWLYFSPENFPLEEHLKKIVEKKIGKNLHSATVGEIAAAVSWVHDHFSWVHPEDNCYSLDAILSEVAIRIETGFHIDAIVIDPWNELDHTAQAGLRDDQYISKCLSTIRKFHRKYDLLTCVIIHPTKMQKDPSGKYPIPSLYDCNGGAMWRNKADFGVCVHRSDFNKQEAAVIIQKIKFKTMGKVGRVDLDYDLGSGRFKDQGSIQFNLPEGLPL